jgi:mono/diheme cytochrome c family protein
MIPLLGLVLLGVASICRAQNVTGLGTATAQGKALYVRNCATCHGIKGDGNGPTAPAFKTKPSDLRTLSVRYGSPLPQDRIARFIDGREDVVAHGPRDMPVWGDKSWEYFSPRVTALVAYLQSIQSH